VRRWGRGDGRVGGVGHGESAKGWRGWVAGMKSPSFRRRAGRWEIDMVGGYFLEVSGFEAFPGGSVKVAGEVEGRTGWWVVGLGHKSGVRPPHSKKGERNGWVEGLTP
jgi:hypothetical protein